MHRFLTLLALVSPALAAGETPDVPEPKKKTIPAITLLPDGSELKGVMLPRYDENHKLVGVLKSKAMKLVNSEEIEGEAVSVEFFNPDETQQGRIDLKTATFYQGKGLLTAKESVEIKSDRGTASGTGLYYSFTDNKGFLLGPATTTIKAPPATTMNVPTPSLRATAALGMALVSHSLQAAPPHPISDAEKAAVHADAVSKAPAAGAAAAAALASLESDLADSAAASKAAAAFLVQNDLPAVPAVPADAVPSPAKPLDITPGPEDTVIHCEGGMYFDPDEGVLVYLKNVTVKDPRFNLSGANELKIFFGKKPEKEPKPDKPGTDKPAKEKTKFGGNIGANFGDVERVVATGAVLLEQKPTEAGKEPIKASGAVFSYNPKADQVILSGGYPWVVQGTTFMRAKQPNLTLRISPKASSFITEGDWDMGGPLDQKK
ncbi:MAG: hypothetical protein V4584_02155 [Verrucomicrobiota bacterium]